MTSAAGRQRSAIGRKEAFSRQLYRLVLQLSIGAHTASASNTANAGCLVTRPRVSVSVCMRGDSADASLPLLLLLLRDALRLLCCNHWLSCSVVVE